MSEERKIYALTDAEIAELVQRCTQSGLDAYQKKEAEASRREARQNDRSRRMKEKLASYRRVKKTIEEETEYTPEEQYEYRLRFLEDLMGDPIRSKADRTERILLDREEKRRQDQFSIMQIDRALELYRQECDSYGSDEDKRRYRVLMYVYINDVPTTVEGAAEVENVSVNTIYRDINIACGIMYQYVVGM